MLSQNPFRRKMFCIATMGQIEKAQLGPVVVYIREDKHIK